MNEFVTRTAIAAVAVMCVFASCQKHDDSAIAGTEGKLAEIEFDVPVVGTKITSPGSEAAVTSLQIFVFRPDGSIEASGSVSNSASLSMTCTTGDKTVAAIVNAPALIGVQSLEDLYARKTDLSENSPSSFVMEGLITRRLSAKEKVTIPVSRCASRVVLTKVSTEFELDVHRSMDFKIKKVMLSNVAGDKSFLNNAAPTKWYNRRGGEPTSLPLICDLVDDATVTSAKPYTLPHYFYCYPNPTTDDSTSGTWCARKTRLVVVASLGGREYFYPVTMPVLEANKVYSVSLKITRPGSSDSDIPVEKTDMSVNIQVNDWLEGGNINEVI